MSKFNEGKACDAIVRRIETRLGRMRGEEQYPEGENHAGPVELTCRIGGQLFAFEHTGIEPFERLIKLEAKEQEHFQPIRERLRGVLPEGECYYLRVPATATLGLKRGHLKRAQESIINWIVQTAPTLPLARRSKVTPQQYSTIPDVPFKVFLIRAAFGPVLGGLCIVHEVERNLEKLRIERIRRAYCEKARKLALWQKQGARAILILEENDIQMTNVQLIAEAVANIELDQMVKPDEIYLLSSVIESEWHSYALRVGNIVYDDFSVYGKSLLTVSPNTLNSITRR